MRKIKNIIRFADSRLLNSAILKFYKKIKKKHGEKIYNFNSKKARRFKKSKKIKTIATVEIPLADLNLAQYYERDYEHYKHYDVAVRMLAIENYYHYNDFGFELYERMQAGTDFSWIPRFKSLIASYETIGYDEKKVIEIGEDLAILDGSHRATLAIYNNQEFIDAKILSLTRNRAFDYDFFWRNDFSEQECKLIKEKTDALLQKQKYEYVGVIWPSAYHIGKHLLRELNEFDCGKISVTSVEDYVLSKIEFVHLFKALYHPDILDEEGMNHKISLILKCLPKDITEFKVTKFTLRVDQPRIELNCKNYSPQSQTIKRIKTIFRKRYEHYIDNYSYDVIMHISDNYLQSKFCEFLFDVDRDISDFFQSIEKYNYIVLRAKESRQNESFPEVYSFRTDSNILISAKNIDTVADLAYMYAINKYKHKWVSVSKVYVKDGINVVIKLRDFMLYQFEFTTKIYGMNDQFIAECYKSKVFDKYCFLPNELEVPLRLMEYSRHPQKKWYIDYFKKHERYLEENHIMQYVEGYNKKRLARLIKRLKKNFLKN